MPRRDTAVSRFPRDFSPLRPHPAPPSILYHPQTQSLHLPLCISLVSFFSLLAFGKPESLVREASLSRILYKTMRKGGYCAQCVHAPFALSMPFFVQPFRRHTSRVPYLNTRNNTRGLSTAQEGISLSLLPPLSYHFPLPFITAYSLLPSVAKERYHRITPFLCHLLFIIFRETTERRRGRTLTTSSCPSESRLLN